MIERNGWKDRKVLITGHTGFKGSWLAIWLHALGAKVTGYALPPPTSPSLYQLCRVDRLVHSIIADIRNADLLASILRDAKPEIVFHLAAQPIVRESYRNPAETYEINVLGTVHLLDAVRNCKGVKAVINVTTDKCYENREWVWGYRENEPLGGYDPYSSSKACSELATAAYRTSYFHPKEYSIHGVGLATARAGNVIGGGDWAQDRLVPDCLRAILQGEKIRIRSPRAVRPWQHVLDPLSGYLLLAQKMFQDGPRFSCSWNFGPGEEDARTVEWLVKTVCERWGHGASYELDPKSHPHEAHYLKLDCSKARTELGWKPRWDIHTAIDKVIEWTVAFKDNHDLFEVTLRHIEEYSRTGIPTA